MYLTFCLTASILVSMNKLDTAKRSQIVAALVEGNSIRATVRMTGASKNTIAKLIVELGAACSVYMDKAMRNLPCKNIQVDEIWSFVGAKQKNVKLREDMPIMGDIWTWVAIDADTKLVPMFMVGDRSQHVATAFMLDLAGRLANRIQLTTDGHFSYVRSVPKVFGENIDYGVLVKSYAATDATGQRRYSPPACVGAERIARIGNPDMEKISTSYVERQNLTMRMSMRRFTRLTNGFSKKVENHIASIAIHYMHYNYCRIHQTLRITPAMAAGISDHVWSLEDLIRLLD
jgi:IS1 family transposase